MCTIGALPHLFSALKSKETKKNHFSEKLIRNETAMRA